MTSQYKICNKCGKMVDMDYNFCPNCKSQSFRQSDVPARTKGNQPSIVHALLYWGYDGEYVISKSKVAAIGMFAAIIIFALTEPANLAGGFVVAIIFAALTFLIGYLIHYVISKPSKAVVENNDYGLLEDLKHFFCYWQNKNTGEFVISKTKLISIAIFIIFFIIDIAVPESTLFTEVIIGLVFSIPAFAIGYGIHMFTNPNPTNGDRIVPAEKPKEIKKPAQPEISETPKLEKALIPEFENYKTKINSLQVEFDAKEEVARELIEKRFQPPQLTYTRFISLVDKSRELFDKESDASMTILNLATEDSPRVDSEIKSKISIMKSIISKIDDLTNELVLTMDSSDDSDVDALIDDMEDIIGSLKDYT